MHQITLFIEKYFTIQKILILSLSVRILILYFYPDQEFPDAQGYFNSGKEFFETGLYPSDFHMPLYPLWTYVLGGGMGLKLSDIFLSVLSIYFIYILSLRLFKDQTVGLIAACIAAVYPHFLFYAVSRLTETSFIAFTLGAFCLLYDRRYFWASVTLVLSLFIRPTFDLLNPVLIFVFAYFIHQLQLLSALKKVALYACVYGALMTPWWVHNYVKHNEFIRLNLGDGHIFYSGNNPLNTSGGGVSQAGEHSDLDISHYDHIKNPFEKNKALKKDALQFIKENPGRFIKLMGLKFLRFWRLWPYTPDYQQPWIIAISILSYGPLLLLSILFSILYLRPYFRVVFPFYLFSFYLMMVHLVTISSVRYRLPIEPLMVILSSFMIKKIMDLLSVKKVSPKK